MGLHFRKPISKLIYLSICSADEDLRTYYENLLKETSAELLLTTRLTELPKIFLVAEKWNDILRDRINTAPSKELALELFKKELQSLIEYDEKAGGENKINEGKYWNNFRKIAYDHYTKGENITLLGLGYLIITFIYEDVAGEEHCRGFSNIDVKRVLLSLAEGVAIADFLHNPITVFREKQKVSITTFEDAVLNKEKLMKVYEILSTKRVIDETKSLTGNATLLYSLMKRFKKLGYFKKITDKDLHPLINISFNTVASYQLYKQVEIYSKELT